MQQLKDLDAMKKNLQGIIDRLDKEKIISNDSDQSKLLLSHWHDYLEDRVRRLSLEVELSRERVLAVKNEEYAYLEEAVNELRAAVQNIKTVLMKSNWNSTHKHQTLVDLRNCMQNLEEQIDFLIEMQQEVVTAVLPPSPVFGEKGS